MAPRWRSPKFCQDHNPRSLSRYPDCQGEGDSLVPSSFLILPIWIEQERRNTSHPKPVIWTSRTTNLNAQVQKIPSPHHAATKAAALRDVSSKPRRYPQQHEVQGRPHHLVYNHHCLWRSLHTSSIVSCDLLLFLCRPDEDSIVSWNVANKPRSYKFFSSISTPSLCHHNDVKKPPWECNYLSSPRRPWCSWICQE